MSFHRSPYSIYFNSKDGIITDTAMEDFDDNFNNLTKLGDMKESEQPMLSRGPADQTPELGRRQRVNTKGIPRLSKEQKKQLKGVKLMSKESEDEQDYFDPDVFNKIKEEQDEYAAAAYSGVRPEPDFDKPRDLILRDKDIEEYAKMNSERDNKFMQEGKGGSSGESFDFDDSFDDLNDLFNDVDDFDPRQFESLIGDLTKAEEKAEESAKAWAPSVSTPDSDKTPEQKEAEDELNRDFTDTSPTSEELKHQLGLVNRALEKVVEEQFEAFSRGEDTSQLDAEIDKLTAKQVDLETQLRKINEPAPSQPDKVDTDLDGDDFDYSVVDRDGSLTPEEEKKQTISRGLDEFDKLQEIISDEEHPYRDDALKLREIILKDPEVRAQIESAKADAQSIIENQNGNLGLTFRDLYARAKEDLDKTDDEYRKLKSSVFTQIADELFVERMQYKILDKKHSLEERQKQTNILHATDAYKRYSKKDAGFFEPRVGSDGSESRLGEIMDSLIVGRGVPPENSGPFTVEIENNGERPKYEVDSSGEMVITPEKGYKYSERGPLTETELEDRLSKLQKIYNLSDDIGRESVTSREYYKKMDVQEKLMDDAMRELASLSHKKKMASKVEDRSQLGTYSGLETQFKSMSPEQFNYLEKMPGYIQARKAYVSLVESDIVVPEINQTWNQCVGTEEEIDAYRHFIRGQITEVVKKNLEDNSVFNKYSPDQHDTVLKLHVQEAEQTAFNFLYSFHYFEDAKRRRAWETDNKKNAKQVHESWVTADFVYNGMCPAESFVSGIVKSKGKEDSTSKFQSLANREVWKSANKKGIDISEGIDEIVVLGNDAREARKKAWTVEEFEVNGQRKTRAYVLTPYVSNSELMPSLLNDKIKMNERRSGRNVEVERRLIDIIQRSEKINWDTFKEGMSKLARKAREVDGYLHLLSGKDNIDFDTGIGKDVPTAEYQRLKKWHEKARDKLNDIKDGLTAKGIRGVIYTNLDLDPNSRLPKIRYDYRKDAIQAWESQYGRESIFYDWDKHTFWTTLSALFDHATRGK